MALGLQYEEELDPLEEVFGKREIAQQPSQPGISAQVPRPDYGIAGEEPELDPLEKLFGRREAALEMGAPPAPPTGIRAPSLLPREAALEAPPEEGALPQQVPSFGAKPRAAGLEQKELESRTLMEDVLRAGRRGIEVELPLLATKAMEAIPGVGEAATEVVSRFAHLMEGVPYSGAAPLGETIEQLEVKGEAPEMMMSKEASDSIFRRAVFGGVSSGIPSAAAGIVGIAATMAGGVVGIPVVISNLAAFALGGGTAFGLAEYTDFMRDYDKETTALKAEGKEPEMDRDTARSLGIASAVVEGGFEFLADYMGGKLWTGGGKLTDPLKNRLKQMLMTPIKEQIKQTGKSLLIEPSTEFIQESSETWLREQAGIPTGMSPWKAGIEAIGPAVVMTLLMNFGGRGARALMQQELNDRLTNPARSKKERVEAADEIYSGLLESAGDYAEKGDKTSAMQLRDMAKTWQNQALYNINRGEAIPLDQDLLQTQQEYLKRVPAKEAIPTAEEAKVKPAEGKPPEGPAAAPIVEKERPPEEIPENEQGFIPSENLMEEDQESVAAVRKAGEDAMQAYEDRVERETTLLREELKRTKGRGAPQRKKEINEAISRLEENVNKRRSVYENGLLKNDLDFRGQAEEEARKRGVTKDDDIAEFMGEFNERITDPRYEEQNKGKTFKQIFDELIDPYVKKAPEPEKRAPEEPGREEVPPPPTPAPSPPKEPVVEQAPPKIHPRYKGQLKQLYDLVKEGEAGKRGVTEEGETVAWGSTFPTFMKNRGWTKKDVLRSIEKGNAGQPLGKREKEIWETAKRDAILLYRDELQKAQEAKIRDIPTGELEVGDKIRVAGETLKVTQKTDEKMVITDGKKIELDPFFDKIKGKRLPGKAKIAPAAEGKAPVEGETTGAEFGIDEARVTSEMAEDTKFLADLHGLTPENFDYVGIQQTMGVVGPEDAYWHLYNINKPGYDRDKSTVTGRLYSKAEGFIGSPTAPETPAPVPMPSVEPEVVPEAPPTAEEVAKPPRPARPAIRRTYTFGKTGSIDIIFPDEHHAIMSAANVRLQKKIKGESTLEPPTEAQLKAWFPIPEGQMPYGVAGRYNEFVKRLAKAELEAGMDRFDAPTFQEFLAIEKEGAPPEEPAAPPVIPPIPPAPANAALVEEGRVAFHKLLPDVRSRETLVKRWGEVNYDIDAFMKKGASMAWGDKGFLLSNALAEELSRFGGLGGDVAAWEKSGRLINFLNALKPAEEVAPAPVAPAPTPTGAPKEAVSAFVSDALGNMKQISHEQLIEQANKAFGGTMAENAYTQRQMYDALEVGINQYLMNEGVNPSKNWPFNPRMQILMSEELSKIIGQKVQFTGTADPENGHFYYFVFGRDTAINKGDRRLVPAFVRASLNFINERVMKAIPTQKQIRTEEQQEFQQFSTPPNLAFLMNWVANIRPGEMMLEPSAGNGGIVVFAKNAGATTVANELSVERQANLASMGAADRIFKENAEQLNNILPPDVKPTVVVMNPPFSSTAGRLPGARASTFATRHVDQALARLQPNGRAVILLGKGFTADAANLREWFSKLFDNFNVRANIEIEGKEYKPYGTTWGNRIYVIDKTGPTDRAAIVTGKVEKIADAIPLLEGVRDVRSAILPRPGEVERPAAVPGVPPIPPRVERPAGEGLAVPPAIAGVGAPEFGAGARPEVEAGPPGMPGIPIPGRPEVRPEVPPGERRPPERPERPGVERPGLEERPGAGRPGVAPARPPGARPEERPEVPGVLPPAITRVDTQDTLNSMSSEEISNMIDDAISEVKAKEEIAAPPQPAPLTPTPAIRQEEAPVQVKVESRPASETIEKIEGLGDVLGQIDALFAPKTEFKESGAQYKGLDGDLYTKLKPLLQQAFDKVKASGEHPKTLAKYFVQKYGSGIKPYLQRFFDESKAETQQPLSEEGEEKEAVFIPYKPVNKYEGSKPHVTDLVETAAMAAISSPKVDIKLNLPAELVTSGKLSEAQLEAIQLAANSFSQRLPTGETSGFFVGDGTGVGKGREISGTILHYWNQGKKKAVWITANPTLMEDATRDWTALGASAEDIHGQAKFKTEKPIDVGQGVLFSTYASLRQKLEIRGANLTAKKEGAKTRLDQLINWLGKDFDGVIVFDEAHFMKNALSVEAARGKTKPSLVGMLGVEMQKRLPRAKFMYSSATGATDVHSLAYLERLGLWGEGTAFPNKQSFVTQIASGGLNAMEFVARDLKAAGKYLSRSIAFNGVEYDKIEHPLTPDQKTSYDALARAWQIVLKNMDVALKETGQANNAAARRNARSVFWGALQRFFNQTINAMQMPSIIEHAKKQLEEGNSIVFQLVNTFAAATDRELARVEEEGGTLEDLDLTPRTILQEYLDRAFPIYQFEEVYDPLTDAKYWRQAFDSEGNPVINEEAKAMKDQMMAEIQQLPIPDNPLNMIVNEFGYENVAEVTGRARRILTIKEADGTPKMVEEPRSKAKTRVETDEFMDLKRRVLIFSDAGGTGRSYHADIDATNQQRRIHYLVQPGWRADAAIQGLGRTHRSNQKQPPFYFLCHTDLNSQKRFISTIARRLDQLGALTKGQRQAGSTGLFTAADNLESRYSSAAIREFFTDLHHGQIEDLSFEQVTDMMGLMGMTDQNGNLIEGKIPEPKTFLNRLLAVEIEYTNRIFDEFHNRLERNIEVAIANGTLDAGMENYVADSIELKKRQVIHKNAEKNEETFYVQFESEKRVGVRPLNEIYSRFEISKAKFPDSPFGFFRNVESQRIWAIRKVGTATLPNGNITDRLVAWGPYDNQTQYMTLSEFSFVKADDFEKGKYYFNPRFIEVRQPEAEAWWNNQLITQEALRTETLHMVVGNVLPVWDRIPIREGQAIKVFRVVDNDRKTYLGRVVPAKEVDQLMQNFSMQTEKPSFGNEEMVNIARSGGEIHLSNGWRIGRRSVQNDHYLEIMGQGVLSFRDELKQKGCQVISIRFAQRIFIPNNPRAPEILGKILEHRQVVRVVQGDDHNVSDQSHHYEREIFGEDAVQYSFRFDSESKGPAKTRREPVTKEEEPRLIAMGVNLSIQEELEMTGTTNLIGKQVRGAGDLATLSEVFRDVRMEHLRVVALKGGRISGIFTWGSRLPNAVHFSPNRFNENIKELMTQTGADSFYILHNHPSGRPVASKEDIIAEKLVAREFVGSAYKYRGAVIIDDKEYSVIAPFATEAKLVPLERNYRLNPLEPTIKHELLNLPVLNPRDAANVAAQLRPRLGRINVVYLDTSLHIRAIEDAPLSILEYNQQTGRYKLAEHLEKMQPKMGSVKAMVIGNLTIDDRIMIDNLFGLMNQSWLLDASIGSVVLSETAKGKQIIVDKIPPWLQKMFDASASANYLTADLPEGVTMAFKAPGRVYARLPQGTQDIKSNFPNVEERLKKARGIPTLPLFQRAKNWGLSLLHTMTRQHVRLEPKKYGRVLDILRQYAEVPAYSKAVATNAINEITHEMSESQYQVFTRILILEDLLKDIDSGLLPVTGLPFEYADRSQVEQDYQKYLSISALNPEIQTAYNKRQDMMDSLRRQLVSHNLLPVAVLKDDRYFHHQVLEYMIEKHYPGLSSKDVRLHRKGWQIARKGSELDFNTEYLEAEFEVISQAISQVETKKTLNRLQLAADIVPQLQMQAKLAGFTARDWKQFMPDGYKIWQPKQGNHFYQAFTITEKTMNQVLGRQRELEAADIKTALAMGRRRQEWAIPEELAFTLDNFKDFKDEGPLMKFTDATLASWKQWKLINPLRVVKYNLNNLSGDLDIVLAYNPKILGYSKQAMIDLFNYQVRHASISPALRLELETAQRKRVIGSGMTIAEIPDIKDIGIFKHLMGGGENVITKYFWTKPKEFTNFRENILRLSAYRWFKDEINRGNKVYGASIVEQIDQITNPDDKAAKLAAELIGDYGNVSQGGLWLRRHLVPFYSWMEINAPRYARLFRNLKYEGRPGSARAATFAGVALGKKAAGLTAKMLLLYAMVSLWNSLFFPDEEKEIGMAGRRQLHLILGRRSDGTVRTIRFQGALSDALAWFALEDFPQDFKDVISGKKKWTKQLKEMAYAGPEKIIHAARPIEKALVESFIFKKSIYPEVTRPRPVRDPIEHLFRTVDLDIPYRYVMGRPTRGVESDVGGVITYKTDPGEQAYYDILNMARDYLVEQGLTEIPTFTPTPKSNALYYYKQAQRFGEKDKAQKYMDEYLRLGGTREDLIRSLKKSHPLAFVPVKFKTGFLNTLDAEDKARLQSAENWWRRVYGQ